MRTSLCLLVLASLAVPAGALAQMGTSKAGMQAISAFKRLDRDGDGGLTRAEMLSGGREKASGTVFALLDADGDGRLSLKEFGVPTGALIGRFDAYDPNKDGFVSRKEFPDRLDPRLFDALDRDSDGRVSLAELRPAFAGSRVAKAKAQPEPRKLAPAVRPQPTTACWVTGFGDNKWILEAPVVWGRCRTG